MSRLHRPIENTTTYTDFAPNACTTREMTNEERVRYGEVNKDYKLRGNFYFWGRKDKVMDTKKDSESKLIAKIKTDYKTAEKRQDEIHAEIDVLNEKLQNQVAVSEHLSGLLELVK